MSTRGRTRPSRLANEYSGDKLLVCSCGYQGGSTHSFRKREACREPPVLPMTHMAFRTSHQDPRAAPGRLFPAWIPGWQSFPRGVSVVSLVGFSTLQLIGALHGYFQRDYALMTGMLASVATCGSVTMLAARYSVQGRPRPSC
jgi:hypothetical protein